jgi:hypothetical protein
VLGSLPPSTKATQLPWVTEAFARLMTPEGSFGANDPSQFNPNCETTTGNNTYVSTSSGPADGWAWSYPPLQVLGLSGPPTNGGPAPTESWSPSALVISNKLVYLYFHDATGLVFRASIHPQTAFQNASDLVLVSTPDDPTDFHINVDVSLTPGGTYEMLYNNIVDSCGNAGNGCVSIGRLYSSDGITFLDDPWFPGISAYTSQPPYSAWTPTIYRVDPSHYWLYFGWSCEGAPADCSAAGSDANAIAMQEWYFTEQQPR